MNDKVFFSVIIPSYNRAKIIADTIQSVIEQDLFHDVKGDFGNDFFLRSCLEHVFAELDGLEGDLVQDSFA